MFTRLPVVALVMAPLLLNSQRGFGQEPTTTGEPDFPVAAVDFSPGFRAAEGIAFNGRGEMYVSGNRGVYRISTDGDTTRLADLSRHLGVAPYGDEDVLVADFGETNWFEGARPNFDGVVWRITPGGERTVAATGIGDPNFILILRGREYLVSDDATDRIYLVRDGETTIFTETIDYPNGMVLSRDRSTLYVGQLFTELDPYVFDGRVWALPLQDDRPAGPPTVLADLGAGKGVDGLAIDEFGRVYAACPPAGEIWRIDPASGEVTLIAEEVQGAASLAFGRGEFDHESLYVTLLARGGGGVVRVPVGARGADW